MEQKAEATLSLETFQKEPNTSIFSRRKIDKRRFSAQPDFAFSVMKTEEKNLPGVVKLEKEYVSNHQCFGFGEKTQFDQVSKPMKNICPGSSHSEALSNIYLSSLFPKSILC